jgi:hypothetical protein
MGLLYQNNEQYYLGPDGIWNSYDENYGDYQAVSLKDIINNFIISYVGEGKLVSKIKRTDVAFHAQRGLAEMSFDILPSSKWIEVEVGPTLYVPLPQDFVGYVKVAMTDESGIERILYPARKTGDPVPYVQDNKYEYLFDEQSREIVTATPSETFKRFRKSERSGSTPETDFQNMNNADLIQGASQGRRYGLDPEHSQSNGVFFIDPVRGVMHFSSNIVGQIISIKYVSDGLATDEESKIHKFAEDALYKYIAYAIVSTRPATPEYIVQRYKKEARASKRNAKLRLSNIKLEELTQVMRGKSKQIKH